MNNKEIISSIMQKIASHNIQNPEFTQIKEILERKFAPESSEDLWVFVEIAQETVAALEISRHAAPPDKADLKNLLRVIDALKRERDELQKGYDKLLTRRAAMQQAQTPLQACETHPDGMTECKRCGWKRPAKVVELEDGGAMGNFVVVEECLCAGVGCNRCYSRT